MILHHVHGAFLNGDLPWKNVGLSAATKILGTESESKDPFGPR
jgi:hypothetical protein